MQSKKGTRKRHKGMITKEIAAQMKVAFEPMTIGPPAKLFVGLFGRPGTGKTRIMATAPRLGVIPLQRKTRPTVELTLKELYPKRRIWWPKDSDEFFKYKNPMELAMMNVEESKTFYRNLVDRIKAACWTLLENKEVDTIGIDSGYTLYQMIVAAHYGRSTRFSAEKTAWEPPNSEMRMLLESLQSKHIVFTTEPKEAYVGKVGQGYNDPAGYKPLGHETNVLVETCHSVADGWWIDIRMCQDRAELQGPAGQKLLMNELIEFKYLAAELRQDTTPEDWE